jgi:hypothetical protein
MKRNIFKTLGLMATFFAISSVILSEMPPYNELSGLKNCIFLLGSLTIAIFITMSNPIIMHSKKKNKLK